MGIYKQFGMLPFIKIDQFNDWQLLGYYKNCVLSLKKVPKDVLVGFKTPLISGAAITAPTTMQIRKLYINDSIMTVVSTQTVTSNLTAYTDGTYFYYYRNQVAFSADPADYLTDGCIYDIYIIDSNNNEFVSEPFLAITNITSTVTKPVYKRTGFLPFYKSDQSPDWKLEGYYKNWVLSLKKASKYSLVSFRTPLIDGDYTTPVNMTLRQLKIVDNAVSVVTSQTITSDLVKEYESINDVIYSYYYRQQNEMSITLEKGCIYDIYITDGTNVFVSDIFLAIDEADRDYYLITEDNEEILTEDDNQIIVT